MRYEKTERELIEGKKKKQERDNRMLYELYLMCREDDCTYLLRRLRGLREEVEQPSQELIFA